MILVQLNIFEEVQLNIFDGGISGTKKVVPKINLTIVKIKETEKLKFTDERPFHMSQRHSKLSINQQSHLGKCSEGKLRISALVNEGTLRSTADFASALICSNI